MCAFHERFFSLPFFPATYAYPSAKFGFPFFLEPFSNDLTSSGSSLCLTDRALFPFFSENNIFSPFLPVLSFGSALENYLKLHILTAKNLLFTIFSTWTNFFFCAGLEKTAFHFPSLQPGAADPDKTELFLRLSSPPFPVGITKPSPWYAFTLL